MASVIPLASARGLWSGRHRLRKKRCQPPNLGEQECSRPRFYVSGDSAPNRRTRLVPCKVASLCRRSTEDDFRFTDRDVPSYFQSLEHLLRYCARPPFALERLSVIRDADGRIIRIRYVLPRHKAANWVGRGHGRKSTRPGANGVVELTPFEFLYRLADLIPPPRKHRHRYHGVFAPNHRLRKAVTALAIGNVSKRQEAATGEHAGTAHAGEGCCDANQKPRSHDTSRIAWAKLLARVGEEFPLECPACGGDIRLIAFITEPGPIRKILTHLGEPLEPPPVSPARGPPIDWGELVQAHDDREAVQVSSDELPAIDIHSL